MSQPRCEVIGDCTLWLGDCLTLRAQFDTDWAVVSDPPYGMSFDFTKERVNRTAGLRWGHGKTGTIPCRWTSSVHGDTEPFDPTLWLQYRHVILWGANHYTSRLPENACWLVWDKRDGTTSDNHSDCEMAWTNLSGPARLYRHLWRGVMRAGAENAVHGPKLHPAQKPVSLLAWCVAMTQGTVLDPYMGSGSTAAACILLGRPFVGCEIDPHWHTIACRRIEAAYKQPDLFIEHAKHQAATQQPLFPEVPICPS